MKLVIETFLHSLEQHNNYNWKLTLMNILVFYKKTLVLKDFKAWTSGGMLCKEGGTPLPQPPPVWGGEITEDFVF